MEHRQGLWKPRGLVKYECVMLWKNVNILTHNFFHMNAMLESVENYTPKERYWILALTFLGFLFDGYDLLIYSFTILPIEKSFHATDITMGLIASTTLFSTLIGALAFGWISDRYGRKKGLMLTVATYGTATFLSAFTQDTTQFFATRVVAGFGIGGEWGIGFSLLSEAWNKKKVLQEEYFSPHFP